MAKLTLNTVTSGYLSTTVLNDNFTKIGEAIEKTLSRDGTMPNQMNTDLDMNGNTINNISDIVIDGVSVTDSLAAAQTALEDFVSLTEVEGSIVGTTDAQTLTNKTVSTGSSWEGNPISENYGGTGLTSYNTGDTLYANAVNNLTTLPVGTQGQVLTVVDGVPTWTILSGEGLGDVSGPTSATPNNLVSFDGTTGKIIKDSGKATPLGAIVGTTDVQTLINKTIISPSGIVKADVGLSAVDNTSDLNKPISTATQTALNGKAALSGSTSQSFSMLNGTVAGTLSLTGAASTLGYGTGAGGVVTQATSKSTAVTLNKPCGQITMNNEALAAGATLSFIVNNTVIANSADFVFVQEFAASKKYDVSVYYRAAGRFDIAVKNITAGPLSEALVISFVIIKGAVS